LIINISNAENAEALRAGFTAKGPFKKLHTDKAENCIHDWKEINREKFRKIAEENFSIDWAKEIPFWSNENKPWVGKAPWPYSKGSSLTEESYKEKMEGSSIENYPEAVKKAKEVLEEWGQDSDKYKISIFESEEFVSVLFTPNDLDILEKHVEIRMIKENLEILSILPGP
jgi:Xaa-Pro aminopeptidase